MTDTMKIWDAVSKTNPDHTKHVSQRGGFTAINANSQVLEATRQFGPIGEGWGYTSGEPIFTPDNLIIIPVTMWHGTRENVFGPEFGCAALVDSKNRSDSDAPKKATTDAITKLLSRLGFNADVFLGLYDDQKYVAGLREEFAEPVAKITDDQRNILFQLFQATGIPMRPILDRAAKNAGCPVADLIDLPASEYDDLEKHLKGKPKKEKTDA